LFLALGGEPKERQSNYWALFDYPIEGALLEAIRGLPIKVWHLVMSALRRKLKA
jgi:hypothetical protein